MTTNLVENDGCTSTTDQSIPSLSRTDTLSLRSGRRWPGPTTLPCLRFSMSLQHTTSCASTKAMSGRLLSLHDTERTIVSRSPSAYAMRRVLSMPASTKHSSNYWTTAPRPIWMMWSSTRERRSCASRIHPTHDAGLRIDILKRKFFVSEVKYLGITFFAGVGIGMDPEKVKEMKRLASLANVKDILAFL